MSQIDIDKGLGGNQLLTVTHGAGPGPAIREESKLFNIGSPQLRTAWVVNSAAIQFSSLVENKKVGLKTKTKRNMQLELRLLYDSIPIVVNVIKHEFKETPEETNIEKKTYILEPFYNLTIPGGHSLNLSLTLKVIGTLSTENTLTWELIEPEVITILDQQFYAHSSLSRNYV